MASLLKSTRNTRLLPAGSGKYVRSDAPISLTAEEIQCLQENNIRTLVDLRSNEEINRKPCCLKNEPGFTYIHLPVTGGGDTPRDRVHLHEVYRRMVDDQMERIIRTLLTAQTNVMYFCTAGKDRTGVVSAVLLRHLGVEDETIIADYMLSKDNLMDMLTAYAHEHPEVDLDIIIPRPENIAKILEIL